MDVKASTQIQSLIGKNNSGVKNPVAEVSKDFNSMLKSTIKQVTTAEQQGENAILDLQAGKAQNLHDVMIAVEKADISLRMLVQIRNKALEAYNEILKLNV